jgi:hypothetical protein
MTGTRLAIVAIVATLAMFGVVAVTLVIIHYKCRKQKLKSARAVKHLTLLGDDASSRSSRSMKSEYKNANNRFSYSLTPKINTHLRHARRRRIITTNDSKNKGEKLGPIFCKIEICEHVYLYAYGKDIQPFLQLFMVTCN